MEDRATHPRVELIRIHGKVVLMRQGHLGPGGFRRPVIIIPEPIRQRGDPRCTRQVIGGRARLQKWYAGGQFPSVALVAWSW